jgi:predicted nucleotidyltransferase
MRTKAPSVLPLFRSDLQARLLAILLLEGDVPIATPELADRTEAAPASLSRELQRLETAGIVEHDRVGRTKRYRAAVASPLYEPLRELVERTLGVEKLLQAQLADIPGLQAAAIIGSWAAGRLGPESDIDVLVVGDVERDRLLEAARNVERVVGREINVTAYRPEEFQRRRRESAGFVATALSRPLVPIVGALPPG